MLPSRRYLGVLGVLEKLQLVFRLPPALPNLLQIEQPGCESKAHSTKPNAVREWAPDTQHSSNTHIVKNTETCDTAEPPRVLRPAQVLYARCFNSKTGMKTTPN